ncbi:sulfate-binding protein [Novosphingobium sediminis]|uniref:Sulfate-binding protein n=1 Tax=Novosphingobium sediminis TaxID=707214 RepID=A0A512AEV0_9SPHN|nr:sulfate ABC transporter substrate-binding protein [Novosphingobium sediminis]GEN98221.1 sulfate-binding protein [Novosphingobium sediminis]
MSIRDSGRKSATRRAVLAGSLAMGFLLAGCSGGGSKPGAVELTNVSYDPTRELYQAINPAFAAYWKQKTGKDITFRMSHGGSGKQSRAIIDGLEADVATLALAYDIDAISAKGKLLDADWQKALPDNSAPYTSTIVFLVRKGNPKGIKDWGDLVKPGVEVITANPKTGGGARWNFLAAWAYGRKAGGSDAAAEAYVKQLFSHVPVLDSGARGSTTTFVERGIGDVLISWENEAFLAEKKLGAGKFEIVAPSISILAEPSVAVVTANAKKHGTTEVADAYLRYLYTPEAQTAIAHNFYRPRDPAIAQQFKAQFREIPMVTIDKDFGGWAKAQKTFFDDGGVFDRIYSKK